MSKVQNINRVRAELRKVINLIQDNGLPMSDDKVPIFIGIIETTIKGLSMEEEKYAKTRIQVRKFEVIK